jgi:hypothetical protein
VTPFEEAAAAASAAVDDIYGEPLEWLPRALQAGGGGSFMTAPPVDPIRQPRMIVGAVTRRPAIVGRTGIGSEDATNADLASAGWLVSVDAALGLDLRAGDRVVRVTKRGRPTLRLAEALPIPGRARHPADQV